VTISHADGHKKSFQQLPLFFGEENDFFACVSLISMMAALTLFN
jgi:hypothetical protein